MTVDEELILKGRKLALGQSRIEAMLPTVSIKANEPQNLYAVPFQRNPHFLARSEVLSSLHQNLFNGPKDRTAGQKSCLVHGGGGMGKTQLAIEYTYLYRETFDYIIWVRAETDLKLANGMAGLAKRLELCAAQDEDKSSRASIEAARTWLETTGTKHRPQ